MQNCQCSCSCNLFDESEFTHLNRDFMRDLNSVSVDKLRQKYPDQCCHYSQNVNRDYFLSFFNQSKLPKEQRKSMNNSWNAATLIQKYLRGKLVRDKLNRTHRIFTFFKKAQRTVLLRQLINGMRDAYLNTKNHRQVFQVQYINACATKIQKVFRGYLVRINLRGLQRIFEVKDKLAALVKGWRVRRIFQTKEIRQRLA